MIIDRGPEPEYLRSDLVKLAIGKMEEFYRSENRSQRRYDFPFNEEIDVVLKELLRPVFHEKCGYCERKIDWRTDGFVDRFRPHSGIRDKNDYFPDCYWWLTFKWDNLIYCCKECLQYKANYFPIAGLRAMKEGDDFGIEDCLLFDPCSDSWSDHFTTSGDLLYSMSGKGNQTINLLRLNRSELRQSRKQANADRRAKIPKEGRISLDTKKYLWRIYVGGPEIEFISYQRAMLSMDVYKWPDKHREFVDFIGEEKMKRGPAKEKSPIVASNELVTNDFFPIEWVRIQNFKGIEDLTISFREDEPQKKSWLFLLGENGVGKSSILQAMAVGIRADKKMLLPLLPKLIRKGQSTAEIIIKERNSDNFLHTILTKDDITQTGEFNSFLMGYGSLRLSRDEAGANPDEDKAKISYENLFRPIVPLNDITEWLKYIHKTNPVFFDTIAYSIKQLLPHDFSENELTVGEEIMFKKSEKQFSELSDGFKSTIILAVDIMMKLSSARADMDKMTGIVLIDELGNQLHPRWQMRIVQQLRSVFKNLNFIVSTHHPLCLRGAEEGEILLLRNIDNKIHPITGLPDPRALRVDQLLASEFFGLSSLIDPLLEAKFNRYYALLARERNLAAEEQEELFKLKDELRAQKQLGATLREELLYTVIDSLLASKVMYNEQAFNRDQLKAEVVARVGDIWKKINNRHHDQG
ncbi:AAA family ATPase [Puia dinghuensis]|uniref:AAA+ ATPase domain-containing protein n=1 Tax=Puia dinghuensis TaxID=1792502 RepID=A0A8J2UI78_9BACT|nr:AAA family ATPase [Puia dinghuensis]GGB19629.1 hypothetical protein GCM10011511_49210 [Puia dinghuensis]